jgi:hypothetical protein
LRAGMADANHFTVTVKRVAESTDVDPHFAMPAHSLTVSPDGHLNIHGQYQSRAFSHGAWDSFEVKRSRGLSLPGILSR